MDTDIEAEVSSALALIENLSIKSSDSGLSEETCWQLFGGPCPEALRKKIRSTVEREEPGGDLYFSAENLVKKPPRNQSPEHVAEDNNKNSDADDSDKPSEANRVLEKFRNFSEIRQQSKTSTEKTNSNQSFSNKTFPKQGGSNEGVENGKEPSASTQSVVEAFSPPHSVIPEQGTPQSELEEHAHQQEEVKKTFSNKSIQINLLPDDEDGQILKASRLKDQHTQSSATFAPAVQKSSKEDSKVVDTGGPKNISPTASSEKPIRQIYSSLDTGESSSEYESSIISDLYKRSKCRNDNLCNCRCCVERRIHSTYRSGYGRENFRSASQKPLENSNKRMKINIFEDTQVPKGYEKVASGNFMKFTSFAENLFDSNLRQCNKRLQTSEMKVPAEPPKGYHSVYIPCNTNPLYQDPMYMKRKRHHARKPTENDYNKSKTSLAQSQSSTSSFEVKQKDAPNIVDCLRNAIKNRNTVRETVSKFEEHRRSFDNNRLINNASRFTAVDICHCCNRPRNERSRRPTLPASRLPNKYGQW